MCLAAYLTSLFILLLQATLLPNLPISPFIPYLATLALKKPLAKALWLAVCGSFALELLSSDPIGGHALCFLLTTLVGYRLRQLFSSESWIQFSLFSAILSFIQMPILVTLFFLFDRRVPFQGKWWLVDFPLLALFDAIYAAIWFIGPLAIYSIIQKSWELYWLKKQNSVA